VLGCGTESDGDIAGTLTASLASNFSAWSEPASLDALNTTSSEQQATLSQDGLTLFFASNRPGSLGVLLDIWVTHRADLEAPWGAPLNLGPVVNTSFSDFAPALSRDGHWLFFGSGRPGGSFGSGDIWAAWRENVHDDFGWQAPINLGSGINSTGFEGGPSYFENDEIGHAQLYYNHNDEPVNTGGDIYLSVQGADGSWGRGAPVVELNSTASEQRPSVGHSGLDIYMYSNRPGSLPDASGAVTTDIWMSTRASVLDPWSPPTNMGPPISSALPEIHPLIFSHGPIEELYFGRTVPDRGNELFVSRRARSGAGGP
jgi:hypothetical protein